MRLPRLAAGAEGSGGAHDRVVRGGGGVGGIDLPQIFFLLGR